jgi:diaminohydroxyphosphoribosylaminopyrimidine deaminase/5-amino-6-(5-phosphoribosylamino)uracil reductase
MKRAIELAYLGRGFTRSNPLVGCVIVNENQKIIAEGHHPYFGGPHAEAMALASLSSSQLKGATLYCTLTPCLAWEGKKTPSCLEKILTTDIKRVVIAQDDPNPLVREKGITKLQAAGKEVALGILGAQAAWMNRSYIKWMTTGVPYVRLKFAQSSDGYLHPLPYRRLQLSCHASQVLVHKLRAMSDAIVVGGNTQRIDAPKLNVRLDKFRRNPHFRQPQKIILSRQNQLSLDRNSLLQWLKQLGQQGLSSLLIEAGPFWQQIFLDQNLFDEILIFQSPNPIGSGIGIKLEKPLDFKHQAGNFSAFDGHAWKRSGSDIVFQGISLKGNPCLQELLRT